MIKYLNLVFFGGMVVMNHLANALPLYDKTTGQLSDAYPLIVLASIIALSFVMIFAVWGFFKKYSIKVG